jgi:HEAT repeat protein
LALIFALAGPIYRSLADAIPGLAERSRDRAREFLVERLSRMTPAPLRDRLREDDPELRRAAAMAFARKGVADGTPDFIELLGDGDRDVAERAAAALRVQTGQSFAAAAEWRGWWRTKKAQGGSE